MSESKHTPGPWQFIGNSVVSGQVCIATVEDDGGYEAPFEERSYNGHLMAAAPDLLTACESLITKLQGRAGANLDRSTAMVKQAELDLMQRALDAIKKAKGEK